MPRGNLWRILVVALAFAAGQLLFTSPAFAVQPHVKVVPWVASNSLIPHDTWSGKIIHLKGTADVQGANFQWIWDYGDGTTSNGTVTNMYDIEATHMFTAPVGTVFAARLTVTDLNTGESDSKAYYIKVQAKSLPVEVNVAIDEGLWYLHITQRRYLNGSTLMGDWSEYNGYNQYATCWQWAGTYTACTALNVNAFEVNGHLESGDPNNPYVETVARGLRYIFARLAASTITTQTTPLGTFNPDGNGNGFGIYTSDGQTLYQGGMVVDAIVASGTPNQVTITGASNVIGRAYKDIVQDMVDWYAYAQYNNSPQGGGWRYNANEAPDNSACQWAAIALIPAEREWGVAKLGAGGIVVPQIVKDWNKVWLTYSQAANGSFGYTDTNGAWGVYATTPSGMVQAVMDDLKRGDPIWDKAETYMGNNFRNGGGASTSVKEYYYGLFSFVKSLLLVPCPTPASCDRAPSDTTPFGALMLRSSSYPAIDWYNAEVAKGDPTDGVARTVVNDQNATSGYWWGPNYDSRQYPLTTGIAIIILNRTVFTGGAPVAVAKATPNPAVAFANITLDGTESFHQDPNKSIVQWDWDINNDGTYELHGPLVTTSFNAVGSYQVALRVTDNAGTPASADTILTVIVSIPPLAPTANAGGPYNFCLGSAQPFFLDGSKSVNPDEGKSEPGQPADTIYANPNQFQWNLGTNFGDAIGQKPDVTAWFTGKGAGQYLIELKVTDTTAVSFPSSGQPNLFAVDSAQVFVRASTDPACATCITNLTAASKNKQVQLKWSLTGADHYNIYRSNTNGGPYTLIGKALATQTVYFDYTVTNGLTYYYVVRPATIGETELCQSNQVIGKPKALW